jgi:hypothetical protein
MRQTAVRLVSRAAAVLLTDREYLEFWRRDYGILPAPPQYCWISNNWHT